MPDINKALGFSFGGNTPEEQIRTILVLNLMTAIVSLLLSAWLYSKYLGAQDVPAVIYITAAFLLAMSGWQFSTFASVLKLRRHFKKRKNGGASGNRLPAQSESFQAAKTKDLLPEADFTSITSPSVTENTTKVLREKVKDRSS